MNEKIDITRVLPKGTFKIKSIKINVRHPYNKTAPIFDSFALDLTVGKKIMPVDISAFSPNILENTDILAKNNNAVYYAIFSTSNFQLPVAIIWRKQNGEVQYFVNHRFSRFKVVQN
jgi:hypothetical protein